MTLVTGTGVSERPFDSGAESHDKLDGDPGSVFKQSFKADNISSADSKRSLRFFSSDFTTTSTHPEGISSRNCRGSGTGLEQCANMHCKGSASGKGGVPASNA